VTITATSAEIRAAGGLEAWSRKQAQEGSRPLLRPQPQHVRHGTQSRVSHSRAKGRLPSPGRSYRTEGMNKTEARYAEHLEGLMRAGHIVGWDYEGVKLRLAEKTFYTPDFLVICADGSVELHEVKGHWEDDARVKIKVAAKQKPWFTFVAVKAGKGGAWEYERF